MLDTHLAKPLLARALSNVRTGENVNSFALFYDLKPSPSKSIHGMPSYSTSPRKMSSDFLSRVAKSAVPSAQTIAVATLRDYADFEESYTLLHELHAGNYGSVSCAVDNKVYIPPYDSGTTNPCRAFFL